MAKKSKSSQRWLKEHFDDVYVKQAQQEGVRSRAVFKLRELHQSQKLFKPGMTVVDLGAAPGGWSEEALQRVGKNGRVLALDILPIEPIPGVTFIEGDFREEEPLQALESALEGCTVDLVLSDMAPNITGMVAVDQPRAMYLAELALSFCESHLRQGGSLVVKVFQGEGFDEFVKSARLQFAKVVVKKPKASRPRSREVYMVATGHQTR